ncbi:unnamed protein product [Polarella glacialis]|uniref:ETFB lysine methyltransferase n=1 Tax=Polarella glacialis TaxID=89957 RepID=A0A813LYT4_POLGL|nr:unnamed protein product [Polarella glacialis]CAE8741517.1 unnamed protein product [Polarella glacialis]
MLSSVSQVLPAVAQGSSSSSSVLPVSRQRGLEVQQAGLPARHGSGCRRQGLSSLSLAAATWASICYRRRASGAVLSQKRHSGPGRSCGRASASNGSAGTTPVVPLGFGDSSSLVEVEMESTEPEALMELFLGLGALSAAARGNAQPGKPVETVLRARPNDGTPLWERSIVSGMFPAATDMAKVAEAVRAAFDFDELPDLGQPRVVEDIDWVEHVQKSWEPLSLGAGFRVLLPWHDGPAGGENSDDGRLVLRLEGGAAFGLGDHPTTQGAVEFLERRFGDDARDGRTGRRVLDYGTGSGVLAICAAHLGAAIAVGVDVEAPSVASAARSCQMSLLPSTSRARLEFRLSPEDFSAAPGFAAALAQELGPFDMVVANILRRPLVALAPALAAAAAPGAVLALTGLRSDLGDYETICQAFGSHFEAFRERPLAGGWLLVEARRAESRS